MEIILLERMSKVGNVGQRVRVKPGFARNFLIPHGKALPATKINIDNFEAQRAEHEKTANERYEQAKERGARLAGVTVSIAAQAGAEGRLFGSVGASDIARALTKAGHDIIRSEIQLLDGPLRMTGDYQIEVQLQGSDVIAHVKVSIIPA